MNIALCLYGHVGIALEASERRPDDMSQESKNATTNPVIAASGFHQSLICLLNTSAAAEDS